MKNIMKEAHKLTREIKREYPEVDYKTQLGICIAYLNLNAKKGEKKAKKSKRTQFNDFRFEGLEYEKCSNKYFTMKRVSEDEKKIVVKVADSHLIETRYGYALILDETHVVFVKDWQVDRNFYGNEVLLNKDFFNVKTWGEHYDFDENEEELKFETWLATAKEQENSRDEEGYKNNEVRWLR